MQGREVVSLATHRLLQDATHPYVTFLNIDSEPYIKFLEINSGGVIFSSSRTFTLDWPALSV